jgi:hypothetical protein
MVGWDYSIVLTELWVSLTQCGWNCWLKSLACAELPTNTDALKYNKSKLEIMVLFFSCGSFQYSESRSWQWGVKSVSMISFLICLSILSNSNVKELYLSLVKNGWHNLGSFTTWYYVAMDIKIILGFCGERSIPVSSLLLQSGPYSAYINSEIFSPMSQFLQEFWDLLTDTPKSLSQHAMFSGGVVPTRIWSQVAVVPACMALETISTQRNWHKFKNQYDQADILSNCWQNVITPCVYIALTSVPIGVLIVILLTGIDT